ncbi:DUF937 domain-containing protein [Nonomuraea sp. ATR24]|uniref:DUF937 domain-containing protein n=1 Tax=Nonomuraea TaxID=83681 RepID=UPI001C5D8718|nr:DUF937 domain-containing protein [Nonomuraea ceibae]
MTLTDQLVAELGDPGLEQLAGMLGTDPATVREVLRAATGVVVAGMVRSSEHPDGAEALRGALDDHVDADPFNGDVATLARDGQNILAHVLGGQGADHAADALADLTGLDSAALVKVLLLLAPMVMSLLADRAERAGMSTQDMTAELRRERAAVPAALEPLLADLLGAPSSPTRSPHAEW